MIRKEKENIKENQQAAVDKSLPGVQARCAVFLRTEKQADFVVPTACEQTKSVSLESTQ